MANIINDRDTLLQAASPRLNVVSTNFISFTTSATGFSVNNGVATPTSIDILFLLNGRLIGNPTITYTGLSSAPTVNNNSITLTTVTVPYSLMNADQCSITATLVYLGNTYTAKATISGSVIAPVAVGAITTTVEGLNLRLSWPRNSEIDVTGYEVRAADTNWGLDTSYLYNGSATTCTVAPGALNVAKTFYIRAYDTTKLFSSSTTSTTYTLTAPSAPTGLAASFSTSSATTSTVTLTWNNSFPPFGFRSYRVRITLPDSSFTDSVVNTPNFVVAATWTGTAVAAVFVTDSLGNESAASSPYSLVKNAPNAVTTPITISTVGTKLLLDWNEVARTSLPIVAYEVRTSNTNWGDGSTFIWKGAVSECQLVPGAVGTPVSYYVKAIDSDNVYSATATATTYTRTAPPTISALTSTVYSTTTTGQANVTFNWNRPAGETFAISLYRVTLTKPGPVVVTADIYANSWTVNADWEGTATLTVQTLDTLQTLSTTTFSQNITKVAPTVSAVTVNTPTPVGNTLVLSWSAGTSGSLPISLYEIRASNNTTVLYKGATLSYAVQANNISVGANTYYLYAIDAAGKYSSDSKTISYTYTTLGGITAVAGFPKFTSNGTALFKWNTPATGSFAPTEYTLTLTGSFTTISVIRSTTDWEIPVNWTNSTATLTITPKDALGNTGTAAALTLTNTLIGTPGAPTATLRGTNLELDWADNTISSTQLPVGWYEIRDYTNTNVVWKGSESWASLSLVGVVPANNTWYIYAYDFNGYPCVTPYTYTYTALVNPSPIPSIVYSFGTNISDSILTLSWNAQTPLFGLKHYRISYPDWTSTGGNITVTTTAALNTVNISPIPKGTGGITWTGAKNFTVVVVDQLGNESTATVQSITKSPPGGISNYTAQVVDNNVLLSWTLPTRTTLPVDTSRIKKAPVPSLGTTALDWAGGTSIGDKTGTFTTVFERAGGSYTYLIAAVDTDNVEGTPTAISATVAQPPDYIFNGQLISQFNGTATGNVSGASVSLATTIVKTNAQSDASGLVLPVDTSATWTTHYTANAWTTPQNQIDAGYPIYIQPTVASGSYSETFDFGQVFSSTKVTANILGTVVAGAINVVTTIDVSANGTTWLSTPYVGTSMFATNFRYVRIIITVTQADSGHGLYRISYLDASLDSKAINDAGTVTSGSETNGTTVNFNTAFIDVTAITLTPSGTTALMAIYDFKDAVISGTYSVTTNVCTVTTSSPHGFATNGDAVGQKVRLAFGSGTAPTGVYTITGVSSTTVYTVSITTANTSGTLTTYPESMKVYVYNNSGVRQSGIPVTWAIRGY